MVGYYGINNKKDNKISSDRYLVPFFTIVYCFFYFITTISLYILSLSQGYGGLSIPLYGGGDDGTFYVEQAKNIANGLPAELTSIHAFILGFIFKIFKTENVLILKLFNYIGNVLLALVALLLLKKIINVKYLYNVSAIILITLLLSYPSLFLYSNLSLYRDVWIIFYYLCSISLFANLFITRSKWPRSVNFFILITTLIMLGSYRKYALLSFIIASGLYLIFSKKHGLKFKRIIITSLIMFSIVYTFLRNFVVPYVNLSFENVLNYRLSSLDAGGSQMGISLDQPNIIYFYLNYFYSVLSNTIGPLPWQINGVATLLVFLTESILFGFIILFLFKQRKRLSKLDLYLIINSTIWFMLISISNDNLGTAARLRIVGWIPLLIVFARHFGEYLNRRKDVKDEREKLAVEDL